MGISLNPSRMWWGRVEVGVVAFSSGESNSNPGATQFGAIAGNAVEQREMAEACDASVFASVLSSRQGALLHCGSLRQNVSVFTNPT
jgi:hypothetical protein